MVLAEVIQAFSAPENAVRMDEARDNACNDMGKMLQFVLPVATQIQQEVIKAYGFSCDGEGGSHRAPRRDRLGVGRMMAWIYLSLCLMLVDLVRPSAMPASLLSCLLP